MPIFITTDATCDLPKKYYKENFKVIPMSYTVNGVNYDGDTSSLSPEEFYNKIREGAMPTTSLINEFTAREFFKPLLEAGNDVLHIAFSSGLSGSYESLNKAAEELQKEYPNQKIAVIDSLGAAPGEGLLVIYTLKKRDEGASFEEIYKYADELREQVCHFVIADDLYHLYRGGRVSKTKAVFGSMLNIKPLIHVNYAGKLIPFDKAKGMKTGLIHMADIMAEKMLPKEEQDVVLIGHADSLHDAEFLATKVKEKTGVENVDICYLGPVIGSHTGVGTIALFFLGKQKI